MKRRIFGSVLLALGVTLLSLGIGIIAGYFWQEEQAGNHADTAMEQLLEQMEPVTTAPEEPEQAETTDPQAGEQSPGTAVVPQLPSAADREPSAMRPMEELVIEGVAYIGYLEIPTLDLKLPVISEISEDHLDIAPCRYFGTAYQKNFVIGGHRYRRHFRKLYTLNYGDSLIFTDVTGESFHYRVEELENIEPHESEYLCSGDWDLSLFTCTPGGADRVVVRCLLV